MDYDDDADDGRVSAVALVRPFARETVMDRFPEIEGRRAEGTLYGRLIVNLGTEAAKLAETADSDTFRWQYLTPIADFVYNLHDSVSHYDKPNPNFWRHDQSAIGKAKRGEELTITRDQVEGAVADYLALPVRSEMSDRTLVDILLATELFAFASEVFGKIMYSRVGLAKGNGPFGFVVGRGCSLLILAIPIALAAGSAAMGWLSEGWTTGIIVTLIGLFLLETAWVTVRFPFAWRAQIRHNAKVGEILKMMNGVYWEMNSSGPISARHIRKRAQAASAEGVGWPAPLFVLLDDIIARGGRM